MIKLSANGQPHDHHSHSLLVRNWRVKRTKPGFPDLDWKGKSFHSLKSPFDGYAIRVSFETYEDHPGVVRIRSTNWRAEHEPSGLFLIDDARRFYLELKHAGFVEEP